MQKKRVFVKSDGVEYDASYYFVKSDGSKIIGGWRLTTPYDEEDVDESAKLYRVDNAKIGQGKFPARVCN